MDYKIDLHFELPMGNLVFGAQAEMRVVIFTMVSSRQYTSHYDVRTPLLLSPPSPGVNAGDSCDESPGRAAH